MSFGRQLMSYGWLVEPIPLPVPDILSDNMPAAEATTPAPGSTAKASRDSHQHPRLTSASRVTLDAGSQAVITYTRTFATKPCIVLTAINPSGRQIQLEVVSDTQVGGVYTGCVIKGSRSQVLPNLGGIALLTGLITALQNFDVLGGSAAGVEVSVVALQASN